MVGFLRFPATTSRWTTFSIGHCNSEIQDGVQDGRHNLIFHIITDCYYIFMCNTSFLWFSRSVNLFMMVSQWL